MIIDGKGIAASVGASLKESVTSLGRAPQLLVIQVGDDPASSSFVRIKRRFGEEIGFRVTVERHENSLSEEELLTRITAANADPDVDGIIVQLPLPDGFDTKRVLNAIDIAKDPDLLSAASYERFQSGQGGLVPPVAAAVWHIVLDKLGSDIDWEEKMVVVVGQGKLVGRPVSTLLTQKGISHDVIDEHTQSPESITKEADILISGVGQPGLIVFEMVKDGVFVIDAGTSESPQMSLPIDMSTSAIAGDVAPEVEKRASFMTPVPGGVGPVAVAMLFSNLLKLVEQKS